MNSNLIIYFLSSSSSSAIFITRVQVQFQVQQKRPSFSSSSLSSQPWFVQCLAFIESNLIPADLQFKIAITRNVLLEVYLGSILTHCSLQITPSLRNQIRKYGFGDFYYENYCSNHYIWLKFWGHRC